MTVYMYHSVSIQKILRGYEVVYSYRHSKSFKHGKSIILTYNNGFVD